MEKTFQDFLKSIKDKRVVVWGLGINQGGLGAALFFAKNGAKVKIVDPKSKKELKKSVEVLRKFSNVEFSLGNQDESKFVNADLVIKNQAIPWDNSLVKKLLKKGVPVERDITLFFRFFKGKIVGITGSKGKTTTTTLIAEFLKKGGKDVLLGGNIRVSLFDFFSKKILENKRKIAVLELSSFQLEDLEYVQKSPHVAVVTNILRDHLNRYGTFSKYIAAKRNICSFQTEKDCVILNKKDKKLSSFSKCKSKSLYFSEPSGFKTSNPLFGGLNNKRNLAAAVEVAKVLKINKSAISKVAEDFKGVPYRMEKIRTVKKITFYNDTAATIPDAAINNLNSFDQKVILICGGADKNLKFSDFAKIIGKKVKYLILLPGTATPLIEKALKQHAPQIKSISVDSMDKAVKSAYKSASVGDVVLLSPGCASFGLFKNEFDRGDQFNEAVKKIK